MTSKPIVVGMTGATGSVYGVELIRALKRLGLPVHLIVSEMGLRTLALECDETADELRGLADVVHSNKDLAAAVSSGSFQTQGMIVAPCSIKTLSGIATSFDHNLIIRAADVTLKERRPLVLVVRETPLHAGHLRLMLRATENGAVILPPMPAFYSRPPTVMAIVHQTVARVLDQFGVDHDLAPRWTGPL
jgi:flavin prenyltransferase